MVDFTGNGGVVPPVVVVDQLDTPLWSLAGGGVIQVYDLFAIPDFAPENREVSTATGDIERLISVGHGLNRERSVNCQRRGYPSGHNIRETKFDNSL
jgi:hypothetical protein